MARGPMDLWNEWAPQILVLMSFALQLILLLLAGIRRREASRLLTVVLWLAYQLADSTAIYAIGHLSLCDPLPEHQLVPFWAPFLILHLGGPDNITAYSLEDTKLWLRHLVSVIVQVSGAAYVLYKQFSGSENSLRLAAVLMFVVGVVKYGERTWALKCGNTDTIRSSLKKEPRTMFHSYIEDKPHQRSFKREADEDEFLVRCAHTLFHICKYAVVDYSLDDSVGDIQTRDTTIVRDLIGTDQEKLYVVMGIELSLMYDILYTKAWVIHNWIGYFIRAASPLATIGAVIIFQFTGKYGQHIVDIAITYVLLTGALLLEVISLLRALGSSWTFTFLCSTRCNWLRHAALCRGRWHWFRRKIVSVRHLLEVMNISRFLPSRKWSGSMGQYNMLHFCTRQGTSCCPGGLFGRLASMLGLEDMWEKRHYSGTVKIPKEVKRQVFKYIKYIVIKDDVNTLGVIRKIWGKQTLKRLWIKLESPSTYLGAEFQEGIIIWHIATELFLTGCRRAKDHDAAPTVEAIKALSNYMMFLLVDRPDMLPGLAQKRLYQRTCTSLEKEWRKVMDDPTYHYPTRNVCTILKDLFRLHDSPNSDPRCPQLEKLATKLLAKKPDLTPESSRVRFAIDLAIKLHEKEKEKTDEDVCSLEVLLQMWIDFLVYAANRCSREAHAKKLNSGGELTTVLWLLTEHLYHLRKLFFQVHE